MQKKYLNYGKLYIINHIIIVEYEVKELNQIIGTIDVVHKSINQKTAEIGYCYGSKYWKKGYAQKH